jgi:hypothetical protein
MSIYYTINLVVRGFKVKSFFSAVGILSVIAFFYIITVFVSGWLAAFLGIWILCSACKESAKG